MTRSLRTAAPTWPSRRWSWHTLRAAASAVGAALLGAAALGFAPMAAAADSAVSAALGPVAAQAGVQILPAQLPARQAPGQYVASVDDFEFASFDAQYYLGRDGDGRSTLRVIETLVAVFPTFDQNRGIRRALPESYLGHPTDLVVRSVTDERGTNRPFDIASEDEILTLTIAADDYVHGTQTYVIEYEQRNVTAYFESTGRDEFYWDVNGLDWAQPFGAVTATVHLEGGLGERLTGDVSAVQGGSGAVATASIVPEPATTGDTADGTQTLQFVTTRPLAAHETLTFAIGFEPGTFTPRDDSFLASPFPTISVVAALAVYGALVWAWILRRRRLRDAPGRGIIITEYTPPEGVNVLTASLVSRVGAARAVPAQLVDLAVRGIVRMLERGSGTKWKKNTYQLELVNPAGVDSQETELLQALFGGDLRPGAIHDLTKPGSGVPSAIAKLQRRVAREAVTAGLRRPYPKGQASGIIALASIATVATFVASGIALDERFGGVVPFGVLLAAIVGFVLTIILISRHGLGPAGVLVRDHLRGLKRYITLAEAERMRFLQSPQGAERAPTPGFSPSDPVRMVQLYERLLPYAMLFGEEKQWATELGRLYEERGTVPSWYVSTVAFNAAAFSSSFGAVSTSLSGAYGASSSGGSGGASAGGGGGGGGGGGV